MNEAPRHNAIVSADPDNPQTNRAWCPACGWRATRADYGMADAWGRARAHNRSTRPTMSDPRPSAEYDAGVRAAAEAVREAMHGPAYAGDPWVCKDAIEAALARVIPPGSTADVSGAGDASPNK